MKEMQELCEKTWSSLGKKFTFVVFALVLLSLDSYPFSFMNVILQLCILACSLENMSTNLASFLPILVPFFQGQFHIHGFHLFLQRELEKT